MLSNGNLHYFWDLEWGNPYIITLFPTPDSVVGHQKVTSNPERPISEDVRDNYIVLTWKSNYQSEAGWRNELRAPGLHPGQEAAFHASLPTETIHALQRAVKEGQDRFLLEMATCTGKTLTDAAVTKLLEISGKVDYKR